MTAIRGTGIFASLAFACALGGCAGKPVGQPPISHGSVARDESFDPSGITLVSAKSGGKRPHPAKEPPREDADIRNLQPFLAALNGLQSGTRKEPVTILQIGDSHTAGDFLSGQMRKLLQGRFGSAGRGFAAPGYPDKYYRPDLIDVGESKDWQRLRSMDPNSTEKFGIAGVTQRAAAAGQYMTMTAEEEAGFNHGHVEVLGAAKFQLKVDNAPTRVFDLPGDAPNGDWIEFNVPAGSHTLKLDTLDGSPVTLLSWGVERQMPGVLYSNLGNIGATASLIGRWDPGIVQSELQHIDPSLIIVAFGTNEAFGNPNDLADFRREFESYVGVLAKAAPGAAIVIVGPPDVSRRYRRPPGVGGDCSQRSLTDASLVTSSAPAPAARKGRRPLGTVWAPPPELAGIRRDERSVAEAHGWYFWDWSAAMGGACAAHRWSVAGTPLSRPDHVHQTIAGYTFSANRLYGDLMAIYDKYRAINDRTVKTNKS